LTPVTNSHRAFGAVYKAVNKHSKVIIAIKVLPAGDKPEEVEKEITVLKKCRDVNIVCYFGAHIRDKQLWVIISLIFLLLIFFE
jgi:hypothetical protein